MRHFLLVEDHLAIRQAYAIVFALDVPQDVMVEACSLKCAHSSERPPSTLRSSTSTYEMEVAST